MNLNLSPEIQELEDRRQIAMGAAAGYLADGKVKVARRALGRAVNLRHQIERLERADQARRSRSRHPEPADR